MRAERVAVVGTGAMGPGIAEVFALAGFEAVLCGRTAGSVESGLGRARNAGRNLEKFGLIAEGRAAESLRRLSGSTVLELAVAEAGIVVETIVEDLAAKQQMFARIGDAAPADAILVTNTSGLSVTAIASGVAGRGRVAGMHWWNPPHLIPLVEVVRGAQTTEETVRTLVALCERLGKTPVVVRKDIPGFIANRLSYALLREAASLVTQGVATAEEIDLAMRAGPGLRYAAAGPFEAADLIGLDVVARIMSYLLPELSASPEPPGAIIERVKSGRLGGKAGRGFYDYPEGLREEQQTEREARLARLLAAGFGK